MRHACVAQFDLLNSLTGFFDRLQQTRFGLWGVAVELLIIGAVVYSALKFLQGTRGERLLKSFGMILIVSFLVVRVAAEHLELERLSFLYPYFVTGVMLTTLVAFQPEIRRGLIRLGDAKWFRSLSREAELVIEPVVTAATRLSQAKIGALIAIQRNVGIEAVVETGVNLDSVVSSELLETIFWPGTVLHDLGVVIHHDRIVAAACQFPISESGDTELNLGSRHRAGLGLSQDCDAIVIIVSEETGAITIAEHGRLHRALTPEKLRAELRSRLTQPSKADVDSVEQPIAPDQDVDAVEGQDATNKKTDTNPPVQASNEKKSSNSKNALAGVTDGSDS